MFVCVDRYDDYDYGEVNQLLERDLKMYIKAVACCPDATKTPVCPLGWTPLKTSERVRRPSLLTFPLLDHLFALCLNHSLFSVSSDTREFTNHGGPAAGWDVIRSESHHSVHDCLSAHRGMKLNFPPVQSDPETRGWRNLNSRHLKRHRAALFCRCASWMCFSFSPI